MKFVGSTCCSTGLLLYVKGMGQFIHSLIAFELSAGHGILDSKIGCALRCLNSTCWLALSTFPAVQDGWGSKLTIDLCQRKWCRCGSLLDIFASQQLLVSSHAQERDKGLLRGIVAGGFGMDFHLATPEEKSFPADVCGRLDGDGPIFWACPRLPMVSPRDAAEFVRSMTHDKCQWRSCLPGIPSL